MQHGRSVLEAFRREESLYRQSIAEFRDIQQAGGYAKRDTGNLAIHLPRRAGLFLC